MEDYEAQEQEFWRKLRGDGHEPVADAEAQLRSGRRPDRSLEPRRARSARAALGEATPPLKGRGFSMKELVTQAKKEGKLNTIALPPDWANYGEIISTFSKKYGIPIDEREPERQLGAGEPGGPLAQGRLARAGRRRRRPRVRRLGRRRGPLRQVLRRRPSRRSRAR